ncbi:MAG TPA: phosphotransferase [Candidatus Acidoferrum sp.]|nr:phosphotransferase [Candidatus Acidoferrum sp.]
MRSPEDLKDTYRLIVTRRNASEILFSQDGSARTLPRVAIRPRQRVAEQLVSRFDEKWGLETYCLFVPHFTTSAPIEDGTKCAVMESVRHNDNAPAGTCWMPTSAAGNCDDAGEAAAIREALGELDSYGRGERPGPFARPGWLRELFRWTEEQVAPLGIRVTGGFRQWNASPTFSLIRLETNDGALWFKATGEPNSHELPVSLLLARLFPRYVPRILGVNRSWNGWLSAEALGIALDEISDCSIWERVAGELAELQIASIGKSWELLEGKCKDLRLPGIVKFIDPFLARMAELMAAQEKKSPAPLSNSEIASLGEGLKESCSLLQSLALPDTIGHIDFNPGNVLVSPEQCVFLDWVEACVTNPMVTFEYLRRHMERSSVKEPAADSRLSAAYLRPWSAFFSPDDLRRGLALTPPVAVFVHAIAGDAWRTLDRASNSALAGYFRSLTRRMYRDAVRAAEGSELCLD